MTLLIDTSTTNLNRLLKRVAELLGSKLISEETKRMPIKLREELLREMRRFEGTPGQSQCLVVLILVSEHTKVPLEMERKLPNPLHGDGDGTSKPNSALCVCAPAKMMTVQWMQYA